MDNPEAISGVPAVGRNEMEVKAPVPPAPQLGQIEVDDSAILTTYANFCRISGSPEELLIDFGVNPQPMGVPLHPVKVSQRVVTGWHTAKRLLNVLHYTIERHEAAFGVLELDVQKRIRRS